MAKYTVTSSILGFAGDIVGITFTNGAGTVDTEKEGGYAAYSYFQRAGYSLTPVDAPEQTADGEQTPEVSGDFDPATANVKTVLAYLADAHPDEAARVLAAEQAGQARTTILGQAPTDPADSTPADQNGDPE